MKWLKSLGEKLFSNNLSSSISNAVSSIWSGGRVDKEILHALHDSLLRCDFGSELSADIVKQLGSSKIGSSSDEARMRFKEIVMSYMHQGDLMSEIEAVEAHHVVLLCGVNGNGKTTTVAKLANMMHSSGYNVQMVACDTFRAAAVEQLKVWGERIGIDVIYGPDKSDPASLAYKACAAANSANASKTITLVDTAGRLHNNVNLMEELTKIKRVITKASPHAIIHTLLVLDATTGQNAINQVAMFKGAVDVSGLILTKLDGTARAGCVVRISKETGLRVMFVGFGEGIRDIDKFDASAFVDRLL